MKSSSPCVLTFNGGSSSIRFAIFAAGSGRKSSSANLPRCQLAGKIERIGLRGTRLLTSVPAASSRVLPRAIAGSHGATMKFLVAWLKGQPHFDRVRAIGHRVVHGLRHSQPERITPALLRELGALSPFDPEHLPREIGLIQWCARQFPQIPQVACFDTAFHRTMSRVARLLPLPRRFQARGVERYGFHGLSYESVMLKLARLDPKLARGKLIVAHLGNGASLAAIHRGKSVDTTMGFTPAGGLVMSTRAGDLDPGLVYYLAKTGPMTPREFHRMVNHESGLLGVSGTSSDMRDLLKIESRDARAADAVALFCRQAGKYIGAFAAVLDGIDGLVFTGGIGENAAVVRERICSGLGYLGIALDRRRNAKNAPLISGRGSRVTVRVVAADEELVLARSTLRIMGIG